MGGFLTTSFLHCAFYRDLSNNELTSIKYPMFYGFHKLRVMYVAKVRRASLVLRDVLLFRNLRKNKIKSVEDGGFFSQKAQHIKEV